MVEDEKAAGNARREQEEGLRSGLGLEESLRLDWQKLQGLDEAQLVKRLQAMIRERPAEHEPLLRAIGMELHGDAIRAWAHETDQTGNEKARIYKFFMT